MLGIILQLFPRQKVGWIGGFGGHLYYFDSQFLEGIGFSELMEGSRVEFEVAGSPDHQDWDAYRMAVGVRFASGLTKRRGDKAQHGLQTSHPPVCSGSTPGEDGRSSPCAPIRVIPPWRGGLSGDDFNPSRRQIGRP